MRRLLCCLPLCLLSGCSLPTESGAPLPAEPTSATAADDTRPAPTPAEMAKLVRDDPIVFLEAAIAHYDREVRGYRAALIKRERINGKLRPEERIEVQFREKPFSVLMDWKEGAGLARKTLYVAGENGGKLLALPAGWRAVAGIVRRAPDDADAKSTARYPITEFGLQHGSKRTLQAWKAAQDRGDFKVRFLGTEEPAEVGKRPCWVVRRVERPSRDPDGIVTSTFYFDTKTYLQLGSVLLDDDDELIGSYYFRDVELNPTFGEGTFTRKGLRDR
jgi:hypothetical protein